MPEDIIDVINYDEVTKGISMTKPLISAHRGAADLAPENTFPAIQKALDLGVEQIEVDVRTSRDGILYDLHDPLVNRTTDGKGLIRLMKSISIDKLNIADIPGGSGRNHAIPRVEQILERYGKQALFYFDVKPGVKLKALLALVYKYNLEERSLFWFKDMAQAARLKKTDPRLALKINVSGPEDMLSRIGLIPFDVIEIDPSSYSDSLRQLCLSRNIAIMVNFIGKEELFAEHPKRWPVEYVNAHRIAPLIPYLEERQRKEYNRV
jgi:glycerophosphoryl diester phosphodiesterase